MEPGCLTLHNLDRDIVTPPPTAPGWLSHLPDVNQRRRKTFTHLHDDYKAFTENLLKMFQTKTLSFSTIPPCLPKTATAYLWVSMQQMGEQWRGTQAVFSSFGDLQVEAKNPWKAPNQLMGIRLARACGRVCIP